MVASLAALTRLIATAPAIPTFEAPAPAVAVAPKVLGCSAPLLIYCCAPTVIAPALIVVPAPMSPRERALTRFSATAAPTPTLAVPEETPLAVAVPAGGVLRAHR